MSIKRLVKIFLIFVLPLLLAVIVCLFFYVFTFSSEKIARRIGKIESIKEFSRTYDDEDEFAIYMVMQDGTVLVLNHVRFNNISNEKIVFDYLERINDYRVFEFIYDENSKKITVKPLFGYFREKEPGIISRIELDHDFEFFTENYKQVVKIAEDFPELEYFSYNEFAKGDIEWFVKRMESEALTIRTSDGAMAGYFKVAVENR